MTVVLLPDEDIGGASVDALAKTFGPPLAHHRTGRPWILGDTGHEPCRFFESAQTVTAVIGPHRTEHCAAPPAIETVIPGAPWVFVSEPGGMRARGDLSAARRVHWTRWRGTVLVSDRADRLAGLAGRPLDPGRVALALCASVPSWPLGLSSFWSGVHTTRPDECLTVSGGGVTLARWWRAPEQNLSLEDTAGRLRTALEDSVRARADGADHLSCDISGGLDSMSLAYLLHSLALPFSAFSSFSADSGNADMAWARRALADLAGVDHSALVSFSETSSAFAACTRAAGRQSDCDEPLAWRSNYAYVDELARRLGQSYASPVHFNGLGGDELFTFLPGSLHAAWRAGLKGRRRLAARARSMQRWGRRQTREALSESSGLGAQLHRQAEALASPAGAQDPTAVCGWAPPIRVPRLVSEKARRLIRSGLQDVPEDVEPYAATHGHHQVVEGLLFQGAVRRSVNQLFGRAMRWESPFVDDSVLTERLRMVDGTAGPEGVGKPLLSAALHDVVPHDFFSRRDKGEYSNDLYSEFGRRRERVREFFSESALADLGLIDADGIRALIDRGIQQNTDLFDLERITEVERWTRSVM
ncbi:asparagine synthase-related protein [uncultured Propionibacterium sp.]|uniref:asparagine synthase-related protein n=1 Tax=uncultured Propionibacterium sp. TaxID=218066 RepID=UPI00292E8588|nr:asparagine synthase-related protein [uncultured Propionibacterium sp.]